MRIPMKGVNNSIYRIGFCASVGAFGAIIGFIFVQVLQLVKVLRSPLDEILIFSTSLCIVIPFVLAILALHYVTPADKKFWSHAAVIFSVLYAVFVSANYVVQLATVIPKLAGTSDEVRILKQTPHSLFWDFDALGYIFMGLTTLMAIPALAKDGEQRWVKLCFRANALITPLVAFVYFYPYFSDKVLLLAFPWVITAPMSMLLLGMFFRNQGRHSIEAPLGLISQEEAHLSVQ